MYLQKMKLHLLASLYYQRKDKIGELSLTNKSKT